MVKIARWKHDGGTQSGFVDGGTCYALPAGHSVQTLLDAGLEETLALARQAIGSGPAVPLAAVQLLAPLVPATIRDFVAFEEHVEGRAEKHRRRGRRGARMVRGAHLLLHEPAHGDRHRRGDRHSGGLRAAWTSRRKSPPSSAASRAATAGTSQPRRRTGTSSATRCSTTGRRGTCSAGR